MLNHFTTLDSVYGKFIVNRNCAYQAEALVKTGRPHIEEELRKILVVVNTLPQGCVVVDGGANIGLVSIPIAAALKSKGGTVHAFEAQRMMAYALSGAAALNDLENLIVHHQGLGAAAGEATLPAVDYGVSQDFGTVSLVGHAGPAGEIVTLTCLDDLPIERLDFLKLDVEGMELDVLKGGAETVAKHLPWCWIEYWKVGAAEIKALFPPDAYRFYTMDNLNILCAPAEKLTQSGLQIRAPEA